jgi:hypothetical protein
MGDVTVRITNTLDQGAGDESIGYGEMNFVYEFNDGRTTDVQDVDEGVENPTALWMNNCDATEKTCQGNQYYGGHNQCAQGAEFWRTINMQNEHPGAVRIMFTGKIWTIDSWDGEQFSVTMTDDAGNVMDSKTLNGNNFANLADQTVQCEGSVGGWQDGYFEISLSGSYQSHMGDVTIKVTNALDQGAGDESIGYGDMKVEYEYDTSVPWIRLPTVSPANYDHGVENPTGLWSNDCSATHKVCGGFPYYGGFNECAQGHSFWRTFYRDQMRPDANRVTLSGKVWTIDSWDGETFTVEMTDQHGTVMDSK